MALDTIEVARAEIAQIYIAAFNRVPDAAGLSNWMNQYMAGKMTYAQIAEDFTKQAEYTAKYPSIMTNTEYVTEIYNNVFGRDPDAGGLTNWVNQLDATSITHINRGNIMTYMLASAGAAGNTDGERLDNQAAFAVQSILDGVPEATATAQLANITSDDATVTAATAAVSGSAGNVLGQTFALTKGLDSIPGTANNDTIVASIDAVNAELNTMSSIDVIDGNAGIDTLKLSAATALATANLANISNVEVITIDAANTTTVDASAIAGLTALNITRGVGATVLTAATTTDMNVSGVAAAITAKGGNNVTVTDATAGNAIIVSTGAATGNAAGKIIVTDTKQAGAGNTITVDGGTDVTVTTTADATNGAIAIGANKAASGTVTVVSNLTTDGTSAATGAAITVTGGKSVNVTVKGTVTSTNDAASLALTNSAVTVTANTTTTDVTINQTKAVTDYRVAAVAEVMAKQTVTFKDLAATKNVVINGLTFTATKALTAAEVAAAFANLTSSDTQSATGPVANGYFTGSSATVAGWTSGAASGASVTFTAPANNSAALVTSSSGATALTVASIVAGTAAVAAIDSDDTAAYGAVRLDGSTALTTVSVNGYATADLGTTGADLDALTTLSLANSAGAATLDTAVASLNLTLNKVAHAVTITDASLKTLNVTTTGADSSFALTAAAVETLAVSGDKKATFSADLAALKTVTVTGSASLVLAAADDNTLTSVTTTGTTGAVTASIRGAQATYTGGAGVDTVTLLVDTALTKAIDLGAGADKLVFTAAVTGSTATLSGGEGTDTLSMVVANAAALDGAVQTFYTGFERLVISDAFGTSDAVVDTETINLANLGFASYVTTAGTNQLGGAIDILVLDKLAANATVALTANGLITATLADATGTADVLNVVLANEIGAAGTLTAAGVETISITTTDTFTDTTGAFDVEGAVTGNGLDDTNSTATLALTTAAAKTINVAGDGDLTLTTTSTVLTTISAASLTGALTHIATVDGLTVNSGTGADILTATGDDVKLNSGAGNDQLQVNAGADRATLDGGAGNDTFIIDGASSTSSTYANILSVNTGDVIKFTGATVFEAAKVTLSAGATETTQALMDLAVNNLAANEMGWFQTGGNTFIVMDAGAESAAGFVNAQDMVVMITGLVDLSTASYNMTSNTLEIA